MRWTVQLHDDFLPEFAAMTHPVQDELLAQALLLERFGPALGRPQVDTLKGSRYTHMKELRMRVKENVWRFAFAFDPQRRAIVLVGADKGGVSQKRFYQGLIKKADERFASHLASLERGREQ